jgi:uncharacterized protein YkwD
VIRSIAMRAVVLFVAIAACAPRNDAQQQQPQQQPYYYPQYQPQPQAQQVPAGWPQDPLVRYNVDVINAYRQRAGLPPYYYDANISVFAYAGSQQLASDHSAHAHFHCCSQGAPGFGRSRAENQGDPGGVPQMHGDPFTNGRMQVDLMLKMMMDEGPGGGHYDNMMSTRYRRVGVGLYYAGGKLYMTNDFSD